MTRKHLHTLLITCIALLFCVMAKAGDKTWTPNPNNPKELLYTYRTEAYPTTYSGYIFATDFRTPRKYTNYSIYVVGEITFSFRNETTPRTANENWVDFHMRINNTKGQEPNPQNTAGKVYLKAYYRDPSTGALGKFLGYIGNLQTDGYGNYWYVASANNIHHFRYYNVDIDDDVDKNYEVTYPDFPIVSGTNAWWDMNKQNSIKIFFEDSNNNILETLRIPRPHDTTAKCYSTTEGSLLADKTLLVSQYRTNLYNRYNEDGLHMNKGVVYLKDNGDGTYLFNNVWDQFIEQKWLTDTNSGLGEHEGITAKNVYKKGALGWTGVISDDKVVEAQEVADGSYRLSIDVLLPVNSAEEMQDPTAHAIFQAIVRAAPGVKIRMSGDAWDYAHGKYVSFGEEAEEDHSVVGVGIDDNLKGNKAYGTVYPTGRVDYLKRIANGGWLKLELPFKLNFPNSDGTTELETRGHMILTSDQPFEVSDIFLLWRPNQEGYYQTSATYDSNMGGDKDIDVSYLDLTKETKFSLFDRGDNLNRVVKVNANTTFALKGHEHPCNVLVEGKNMPLLYLTDRGVKTLEDNNAKTNTGIWNDKDKNNDQYMKSGYTFGVNEGFTADKVWFDRNFAYKTDANGKSHSMSTICLPFAMDATDLSKFNVTKAYEFVNATGNKATFKEVTSTEADKPYLIEPSEAISTANEKPIEFVNKQIPASTIADGDFIGTYKYSDLPASKDGYRNYIFGFNTQKFNYVKSSGASFKPFRAYLRSKQSAGSLAKSIVLQLWDGSTTDIMHVDDTTAPSPNAPLYTIDGRMVSPTGNSQNLPKGIYIQNGKKFVK
ncbi:hypothetical protein [Hallella bergensis]|uniref:hypothetical protein n=1 Tax=Hallella bergensis TaxID=242750 RepID=UPI003990CDA9